MFKMMFCSVLGHRKRGNAMERASVLKHFKYNKQNPNDQALSKQKILNVQMKQIKNPIFLIDSILILIIAK